MRLGRRQGWWIAAAAVVATVLLFRAGGLLQTLEHAASDVRAAALSKAVDSDIVIVGVDARSLAALDRWPWPRRHHAGLIKRLAAAGPRSIFLDIDFSAPSNALDDAVLESALAGAGSTPIFLPAFFQPETPADDKTVHTQPLERFARYARLVAVNRRPASDGLERSWRSSWNVGGRRLQSIIDPETALPRGAEIPIDYSISPASFSYVSFIDALNGEVAESAFRGKTVYVGATAVELGDMVAVPIHRSLPGVVVQALATESVRRGPPWSLPAWAFAIVLAAWTLLSAALLQAQTWRRNAVVLVVSGAAIAALSFYAFIAHRLLLEVVPFALATGGIFLAATLRSLDLQTWRAVTYALGMRRRDALLKSIVHSSTDCIVCVDEAGLIQTANPAAARLFVCGTGDLVGTPIARFIPDLAAAVTPAPARTLDALHGGVSEWTACTVSGATFPVELAVSRVRLHNERLYTAIVRDISERKAQQRKLEYQATHDSLTQLPNRAALMQRLDAALSDGDSGDARPVALLMLDLCRFKEVNDTLGHNVGDLVLTEVARRFQAAVGGAGFIARIGGDEFTVVMDGMAAEDLVAPLTQRLCGCLREPIDVAGISIEVGLSIGIARSPRDASDAQTLLKRADVAMYVAKKRGAMVESYDAALDDNSVRRLSIGGELRAAIAADALEVHYQPQVNLRSGLVEGVEALLRWPHPSLGQIGPAEFITIAESTDLIRPLTEWSISRALRDTQGWRHRGLDVRCAVNLSARLLQDAAFPERLQALLAAARVNPGSLELEITESAMMLDPARALRIIQDIARQGVRIAIDDFGTGYSSLGYLRDLPVSALKLDKSFVMGMQSSVDDRIIVESTAQMAHALKLEVVAEGVETAWDANFLASAGYDVGQGYYYSAALPALRCRDWILQYNTASTRMIASARR
jgi:diguanylate cyclase (GGDEF)-like protein/PAS domain S-box-containing protein